MGHNLFTVKLRVFGLNDTMIFDGLIFRTTVKKVLKLEVLFQLYMKIEPNGVIQIIIGSLFVFNLL